MQSCVEYLICLVNLKALIPESWVKFVHSKGNSLSLRKHLLPAVLSWRFDVVFTLFEYKSKFQVFCRLILLLFVLFILLYLDLLVVGYISKKYFFHFCMLCFIYCVLMKL